MVHFGLTFSLNMRGLNLASLIGLLYLLLGLIYLPGILLTIVNQRRRLVRISRSKLLLYGFQSLVVPIILWVCGLILVFNGWRLDPILQVAQLLSAEVLVYLALKDLWGLFNHQRVR